MRKQKTNLEGHVLTITPKCAPRGQATSNSSPGYNAFPSGFTRTVWESYVPVPQARLLRLQGICSSLETNNLGTRKDKDRIPGTFILYPFLSLHFWLQLFRHETWFIFLRRRIVQLIQRFPKYHSFPSHHLSTAFAPKSPARALIPIPRHSIVDNGRG